LAIVTDEVEKPEEFETSAILRVLDRFYNKMQIEIAKFISEYYFSSFGEAIAIFMPYSDDVEICRDEGNPTYESPTLICNTYLKA
jgi:primosomal protein N' (replication factor Y)